MRAVLVLAAFAMVAACSPRGDDMRGEPIPCALGLAGKLEQACRLEVIGGEPASRFAIHHPDGAFRRFSVASEGRGLVLADGAEQARFSQTGETMEIVVGEDRYSFPASLVQPKP